MKRDNMFIYVGAAIFVLLAVALGIIMYMFTKTTGKLESGTTEISQQQEIENVTSDIGKTVEEQTENIETEETTTSETPVTETNIEPVQEEETPVIVDEPDTTTQVEAPVEKKEITFTMPVEGEILCEFAKDNLIYSETLDEWITHTAIDIKADKTSVIKSAADGIVRTIVNDPRYGLTIIIEHEDGYETIYSNLLTAEFVVEGEEVTQGQTIGTVGNTAVFESSMQSHLHFELIKDGEYLDPSIHLK